MSKLEDFLDLMRLNREKSPWMREQTFNDIIGELRDEVDELAQEDDPAKIRDELGDVLMDTFSLIAIAEDNNWFTTEELLDGADAKLRRRKPWIFEEHNLTAAEEVKRWNAAKKKE